MSDEHLVRRHTSLVALLDRASSLGSDVTEREELEMRGRSETDNGH